MIEDGNGNVVVQYRNDPQWPGAVFPGGHVKKNESICDSVKREIKEETGLVVNSIQFCGVKQFFPEDEDRYIVFLYKATSYSGEITSSSEGNVEWTPLEKIKEITLAPGFEDMLPIFMGNYQELIYNEGKPVFIK